MAGGKEVKTKIKSVENTQKITKAMEMVAASKMRKAQERVEAARPYAQKIRRTIGHLAQANPDFQHPFMVEREVNRVGMIIISTDRGLCGGLNINLFRRILGELRHWEKQNVPVDIVVVGRKAASFFRRIKDIKAEVVDLGDVPHLDDLIGSIKVMLDGYREGEIDRLFLMGNEFVNTMTQKPEVQQLLPVPEDEDEELPDHWDYIYEPEPAELLESILVRYVEAQVYQGVVENVACEMAARMVAMKSASDNAGEIIDDLQLEYNKQRQAAITQELSEIVAGAAAVS
ncbi:F0F1 ATP synthase subunit gamma [Salinisphaera sp.]|uniref:F0F1 ATP synthase subunit gamma n=1 Tax=Salinisphaera sp. TaxID=1914330 RepID=UPI000C4F5775|nr:F0F1 ATP synthase subunit gamma [Salinisphaera sp.]MAS09613.1 F0F1 ATP synthase subunit gamma [Salinisphaera sp.]|tara:strand:+ start:121 stop:981 length:861 start_codon:yes stop_codon:yes gene_type:complete